MYKNDKLHKLHREDGPAIIHFDGTEMWYKNNKLIKIVYENKEYIKYEDVCILCLVKSICSIDCKLNNLMKSFI